MDERTRKKNTGFALLFGMAAGAALGWWLNSDRGRAWRRNAADTVSDYSTQVSQKAAEGVEVAKETVSQAVEKGKVYADNVSEVLKEKATTYAENATNVVEKTGDALKEGAEKARQKIRNQEAKIDKVIENHKT